MVSVPGLTDSGVRSDRLTESVDIFPTLVEAAGFPPLDLCPVDSTHVELCREGDSLMPLIENPTTTDWKEAVFWQEGFGNTNHAAHDAQNLHRYC